MIQDKPIVIHSGLIWFRRDKDPLHAAIGKLESLMRGTVLMPAYTFGFAISRIFDVKRTPPSTGMLACEFLKRYGVSRTERPMNSYGVWGDGAMEVLALPQTTAWGHDSVMGWLVDNDAVFVSLGVSTLKSCSYFHYAEEKLKVPYRYWKTFDGGLYEDGYYKGRCWETMFVGPRGVEYDFKAIKADNLLEQRGLKTKHEFMEITRVRDIVDVAEECLMEDPYSLCHPKQEGREAVREYVESGKLQDEQSRV